MPKAPANCEDFKLDDAHSYDPVIAEFDRATARYTTPLAEEIVDLADLNPGHDVLDIGTGSGIVALTAAARVRPRGTVLGIDLSGRMLQAAAANARRAGFDQIRFREMDAEQLDLPDASFDRVLSLFALLHFPRPEIALREMYRVLRPGGLLVVAVGSSAPLTWRGLVHRAGRLPDWLLEKQGKLLFAPRFLDSLVRKYLPQPEGSEESPLAARGRNRTGSVPRLVEEAGFTGVRCAWKACADCIATAEEFWNLQRTYSSIARKRLATAPPDKLAAIKHEFFDRCRRVLARRGRLMYHRAAFSVVARRPGD